MSISLFVNVCVRWRCWSSGRWPPRTCITWREGPFWRPTWRSYRCSPQCFQGWSAGFYSQVSGLHSACRLCCNGVRKLLQSTLSDLSGATFRISWFPICRTINVACVLMVHIDWPLLQIRLAVLTRKYVKLSATTRLDVQTSHTPN